MTYIVKKREKFIFILAPYLLWIPMLLFKVKFMNFLGVDLFFSLTPFDAYIFNVSIIVSIMSLISSILLERMRQNRIFALDLPILYQKKKYVIYGDKNVILIRDILFSFDEVEKWRDASYYTVEVTINNKEYDWRSNYEVYQFIMKNLKDKGIYQHELGYINESKST